MLALRRGILADSVHLTSTASAATRGCQSGHGFAPDVAISYELADFLAGRDPYLAAVAALPAVAPVAAPTR